MSNARTNALPARWLWIGALWCAGGLLDAMQSVLVMLAEGHHHAWQPLFFAEFATWVPWVFATPLIGDLARRLPMHRGARLRALAGHGAGFLGLSLLASAWSALLTLRVNPWNKLRLPGFGEEWRITLLYQSLTFMIVYGLIVAITTVLDARARLARQQTAAAQLNEQLSHAQLAALRRQIEPHFMFNTLNSIAGLVREQRNDAAVSMIVGLSEFLRRASESTHRSQVSLGEEAGYLQRYLEIQQVRFAERLQVHIDIPADLLPTPVPNLLLQPLVENAIKHGISQRIAGGTIRVSGERRGEQLVLCVCNDGPALPPDWSSRQPGIGIANLRTRLQLLHGSAADLQLRNLPAGGVEVRVTLPLAGV
jgi:signal transduction histidine kinase